MSAMIQKQLTNKSDILQKIYDAKRAHIAWVKKIDKLVNGLDAEAGKSLSLNMDSTFIPLESKSSEFGEWFYTYGVHLNKFESIGNFVERIEVHHQRLHQTYASIYTIFFSTCEKPSLVQKLLKMNKKSISDIEREKAKIHLNYLKKSSKELLQLLEILHAKVKELNYDDLRKFTL
jgi:hypothetical protein